jgi:membrane-bound lytic murein transglycosylase B
MNRLLLSILLLVAIPAISRAIDIERPDVRDFIEDVVKRDHLERGWVEKMISAAESKPAIIDTMKKPAEHVLQWHEYRRIFMTPERIRQGHEFISEHRELLQDVESRTGVNAEIIAAIVGVETSYGRKTGHYRVLDALATLGFDYPPRAAFFRGELEQFLMLAKEAGIDPLKASGSYAGAMGAPQFMPRSVRAFARDGDRDGKIDLWTNWKDIAESVAHYFVAHGWVNGEPIYAEASMEDPDIEGLPGNQLGTLTSLEALAVKGVNFESTLAPDSKAVFISMRNASAPLYIIGMRNFVVITKYNKSPMYALAVAQLAEALKAPSAGDDVP